MRNPQSLLDSPATQPYNQDVKPAFAMQQPMVYSTAGNPNMGFQNQQPAPPVSPSPGYAFATPGNDGTPQQTTNQIQFVTPTSLYGTTPGINQTFGEEQTQNPQPQPVTPPGQFAAPTEQSWNASAANTMAPSSSKESTNVDNTFDMFGPPMGGMGTSVASLPGATPGVVPDNTETQYHGVVPGMGALAVSPEQPQQHQNYGIATPAVVPENNETQYQGVVATPAVLPDNTETQYQGVVQGMGALAVSPEQPQQYQNYGTPQQNNGYQQPGTQSHQPNTLGAPQQQQTYQPYNQQQAAYPSAENWNSFAQQPYPQQQQQQQQQHSYPVQADVWPGDGFSGAQSNQLPNLNHPGQAHGAPQFGANQNGYPVLGNEYEATPYGQDAAADQESAEHKDTEPVRPCADHKSSNDVMREYGAGLRALRLLDETTKKYNIDDDGELEYERRSGGLRQAAKYEHAKHMKAKQIRKMKKLEYKNKKAEMLAESSRTVKSVRKGYDPELTSDKCQLDFDRQRDAQVKALKLMSSMF